MGNLCRFYRHFVRLTGTRGPESPSFRVFKRILQAVVEADAPEKAFSCGERRHKAPDEGNTAVMQRIPKNEKKVLYASVQPKAGTP